MKYIITAVLTISVLWQGGFSDMAWLIFGVIAAVLLIIKKIVSLPTPIILFFIGLTGAYILSAILNGAQTEGFIGAVKIIVTLMWFVLLYNSNFDISQAVFISGIIVSIAGIFAYCGLLPIAGMVSAGRLQGTFQYANTFALYLGVCALLTRLSGKYMRAAAFMEIAMFLTNSIGGIAVFAGGFILTYIISKDDRKILNSQYIFIIFSLLCAGAMVITERFFSQYAAILPVIVLTFLLFAKKSGKLIENISKYKNLKWITAGIFIICALAILYQTGGRPFNTYIERLIQISDGIRTIIHNPLGIGAGSWSFVSYEKQSAFYDAVYLHSGYVSIGAEGGIFAVALCLALIFYRTKQKYPFKYSAAAYMILVHSAFDFSFSFFSVIMLLCLLSIKESPEISEKKMSKRYINIYKILCVPFLIICIVFAVPRALINNAMWAANSGDFFQAAEILKSSVLKNSFEANLLRLHYTEQIKDYEQFDETFALIKKPNAEAYYLAAEVFLQREKIDEASQAAILCAENSPYCIKGYELMEEVGQKISNIETRESYEAKISELKMKALGHMNPLAKYIPDNRRLQ